MTVSWRKLVNRNQSINQSIKKLFNQSINQSINLFYQDCCRKHATPVYKTKGAEKPRFEFERNSLFFGRRGQSPACAGDERTLSNLGTKLWHVEMNHFLWFILLLWLKLRIPGFFRAVGSGRCNRKWVVSLENTGFAIFYRGDTIAVAYNSVSREWKVGSAGWGLKGVKFRVRGS